MGRRDKNRYERQQRDDQETDFFHHCLLLFVHWPMIAVPNGALISVRVEIVPDQLVVPDLIRNLVPSVMASNVASMV